MCSIRFAWISNRFPQATTKKGSAVFIRLSPESGDVLAKAHEFVSGKLGWDLSVGTQKDLFLTHSLIAQRAGYDALLESYKDRKSHATSFSGVKMLKSNSSAL